MNQNESIWKVRILVHYTDKQRGLIKQRDHSRVRAVMVEAMTHDEAIIRAKRFIADYYCDSTKFIGEKFELVRVVEVVASLKFPRFI